MEGWEQDGCVALMEFSLELVVRANCCVLQRFYRPYLTMTVVAEIKDTKQCKGSVEARDQVTLIIQPKTSDLYSEAGTSTATFT